MMNFSASTSFKCVVLCLLLAPDVLVADPLYLQYENSPLLIDLTVGREQRLHFGDSVEIGVPSELASKLEASSVQGIAYFKPLRGFSRQRVFVKLMESGHFVLLDVAASNQANSHREVFISLASKSRSLAVEVEPTPIELSRYAAQQLVSPRRLLRIHPQIKPATVDFAGRHLYLTSQLEIDALGAWQTKRQVVVAYSVRNTSQDEVVLTPEAVRGDWRTVSFMHKVLRPGDSPDSRTVMLLVGLRASELSPLQ